MVSLDASALVSLFVEDANSASARRRIGEIRTVMAVSTFAAAEFAAAIGRRVRAGAYDPAQGAAVLALFDAWMAGHAETLDVDPEDHRVAAGFVRHFELGLRAPDALHIAICQRLRLPLLTFDARQAAAAQRLGVACDPGGATGPVPDRPGP
jgi:predicted nucleic acid-binding protein